MTKQVRMYSLNELTKLLGGAHNTMPERLAALDVAPASEYVDGTGKTRRWYTEAAYKKVKAHVAAQVAEAPAPAPTPAQPDLDAIHRTIIDLANSVARVAAGGAGGHKVLLSRFHDMEKRLFQIENLLTAVCKDLGVRGTHVPVAVLNGAIQAGADDAGADDAGAEPH